MRYIRFLKTPRIVCEKGSSNVHIFFLITITSDLGDSFLPCDLVLAAEIVNSKNDQVTVWKTVQWTAGMRSLAVTLPLSRLTKVQPFRIRVGAEPKSKSDSFASLLDKDCRGVVSAWSAPLNPAQGSNEAEKIVQRRFRILDQVFYVNEETGESIARHLWDAGVAVSCKINELFEEGGPLFEALKRKKLGDQRKVLELGTGCGLVGIAISSILPNADILLTDLTEAKEIAGHNIAMLLQERVSKLKFAEVDWDKALPPVLNDWASSLQHEGVDLIIAADCTYNPDSSPALVNTIRRVATLSPHVTVAIAMKIRHFSEDVFFDLMSKAGFHTTKTITFALPGDESPGEENVQLYIYQYEEDKL